MVKAHPSQKNKGPLAVDTRQLEQLRSDARNKVREFLWGQSFGNKKLAANCARILHGPVCMFAASLSRRKIHRKAGKFVYEQVPSTKAAISSLRRLERHALKGGYQWEKAWAELTPAARKAVQSALGAGFAFPIGSAPKPDLVRLRIAAAMEAARIPRASTLERDVAVVAVLRAYVAFYRKKPPSPTGPRSNTVLFITEVEKAYRHLLPNGFGVSRSKATLDRLIKQAWPSNGKS